MPRKLVKTKKIIVPYGTLSRMAKDFNCRVDTVSQALKFNSNSEQAELLRTKAIKEYGGYMQHSIAVCVPRSEVDRKR